MPCWLQLGTISGFKLEPSWLLKSTKSRPKRLPRRTWEPEPPQTSKIDPKWPPRPPKMRPQTPHLGSILTSLLDIQTNLFKHFENDFAPFTGWIFDCFLYCMGLWIWCRVAYLVSVMARTRLYCTVGYSLQLAQMFYYEIMTHNGALWGRLNSIGEIRRLASSSVDVLIRAAASAVRPLQ